MKSLYAYRQRAEAVLGRYFDDLPDRLLPAAGRWPGRSVGLLRDLTLRGGKRLRAAVVYAAAGLVTGADVPGLDSAVLGVELLHTHGLVHDDIIDDAPTRRGGPSTYHAYRAEVADPAARNLAILAGDLAAFLSVRAVLDAPVPAGVRQAMAAVLTRAAADAVLGQILDLERDATPDAGAGFLDVVTDHKSARYSILAPLQLGLLAAGAEPADHEEELRRYAWSAGIYEQMRDDYLDLFGDEGVTGKPVGGDIRAGRRTYVVRALLEAPQTRRLLLPALGDPAVTPEVVAELRDRAVGCGIAGRLRDAIRHHARTAAAEAATWRWWRTEATAFFRDLPLVSMDRIS
ncbi:polyprenyl synthetase family protein [Couchioplanes caeruleus]|uniref:polyprenyl synthetase family protein n=1 Tax=Couchioplanes caeruleus TaxID=56438 RepID=UPI0020C16F95|nr:polyprenyl synthetase family protein [Couchioplanes caeruleus]UQU62792.1 polyprenyl synthetase family protein [Couchioplanes caeruleus]